MPPVVVAIAMLPSISGNVFAGVPPILNKVDPFATGVVPAAVLAPMFRVAGWHAQVDGRAIDGHALHHDRPAVNHLWPWVVPDIEPPVKARLANVDGYADASCMD